MNYVVTGGAGFVGSHLVNHLINEGHSVTIVDNLHSGKIKNLENVMSKIKFHKTDILDYQQLKQIFEDSDGIFHQAALTVVQESFTMKDKYYDVNVNGTENIFRLAKEFGLKVVYASSSSVYGNTEKVPIMEDAERKPINPYGETKLKDEFLVEKYAKLGVSIIGLRYFNIYGKGQSKSYAGVITKFMENLSNSKPPVIYGDGSQLRDFVYVGDVARANLMAMESSVKNGLINIGSGVAISISELARMMIESSKLPIEPEYTKAVEGDIMKSQSNIELAKKLLNWEPKTKLKEWLDNILKNTTDLKEFGS